MTASMSPFTLQSKKAGAGGVYQLPRSRTVVGRSKVGMPDIELDEVVAAPRHCVIDWDEKHESHSLMVLGLNGVYLNGEFLDRSNEPCGLQDGDDIRIGETTFVYARSTETAV